MYQPVQVEDEGVTQGNTTHPPVLRTDFQRCTLICSPQPMELTTPLEATAKVESRDIIGSYSEWSQVEPHSMNDLG